jgi:hypothetical protein
MTPHSEYLQENKRVRARGDQPQGDDFLETGFTGRKIFIAVGYSVISNCLLSEIDFSSNVKWSRSVVHKKVCAEL